MDDDPGREFAESSQQRPKRHERQEGGLLIADCPGEPHLSGKEYRTRLDERCVVTDSGVSPGLLHALTASDGVLPRENPRVTGRSGGQCETISHSLISIIDCDWRSWMRGLDAASRCDRSAAGSAVEPRTAHRQERERRSIRGTAR